MCCKILIAEEAAMATTQLTRVVRSEVCWQWQDGPRVEQMPLRMSWVVVTDEKGKPKLALRWLGN
jgi:hypothetical protein